MKPLSESDYEYIRGATEEGWDIPAFYTKRLLARVAELEAWVREVLPLIRAIDTAGTDDYTGPATVRSDCWERGRELLKGGE